MTAVVAYGCGEWAGFPVLRVLSGAAFGAVAAALVLTARRPRVVVTREVYPDRVQRGRPAFARLRVHNDSPRRHGGFTAGDRVDGGFHAVAVRPSANLGQTTGGFSRTMTLTPALAASPTYCPWA